MIVLSDLRVPQIDGAIARDRHDDRVILIRVLHVLGGVDPGHIHRHVLLQHRGDHHEDDQQNEHDVGHGDDVGRRHLSSDFWLVAHGFTLFLRAATQNEVVDQLHRGVVHLDVEGFDFVGEVVVGPHGRNGDEKTETPW